MIKIFDKKKINYYANVPSSATYPDGMDIIFYRKTLSLTYKKAKLPSEKEHVTPYMFKSKGFKILKKNNKRNL